MRAAMECAAADYARETEQLAALKVETEAKVAEKVRRSRLKGRKKEQAAAPPPPPPNVCPSHLSSNHSHPGFCHSLRLKEAVRHT